MALQLGSHRRWQPVHWRGVPEHAGRAGMCIALRGRVSSDADRRRPVQLMWYPFKFWRNVCYVHVTGRLAEVLRSADQRPKRRTLRAVERAKKADAGYLLAVPGDDWQFAAIEGWSTQPDDSLQSVTARFVGLDGNDVWVQTSLGRGGTLRLIDTESWAEPRSPFEGTTTMVEGRIVEIALLAGEGSSLPRVDRMRPLRELLSMQ